MYAPRSVFRSILKRDRHTRYTERNRTGGYIDARRQTSPVTRDALRFLAHPGPKRGGHAGEIEIWSRKYYERDNRDAIFFYT